MIPLRRHRYPVLLTVLLTLVMYSAGMQAAQETLLRVIGIVYDSTTDERLSYVSVIGGRGPRSTVTDSLGRFILRLPDKAVLHIKSEGYAEQKIKGPFGGDTLRIALEPKVTELEEFVVRPKKQKYNKRNPAVDLMEKVRRDSGRVHPDTVDGYNYDVYDKISISLLSPKDPAEVRTIPVKDRKRVAELLDTMMWTGEKVIDLAVKERSTARVFNGGKATEIIRASRSEGADKAYSQNYTDVFLRDVMGEVNLYDNDIHLLRNSFVSPLSRIGADFYKYEITDTLPIGHTRCVELSFAPHTPEMTGFNGKLYIPVDDSVKYVRRAMLRMPKAANVNYIRNMVISQNYMLDSLGRLHKTLDDVVLKVKIAPGTPDFYFTRQSRYENFNYEGRPEYAEYLQMIGDSFTLRDGEVTDEEFWQGVRRVPLSQGEANLISKNSIFKTDKGYWWFQKILSIVVKGYIQLGNDETSKFDIGPIGSFLSYNKPCGWRIQFGGTTTANLMPHLFLRGYGAYSFRDHKWKGGADVEYSFEKRRYAPTEFPINSLRAGWSYDIDQIGQSSLLNNNASLIGSVRRVDNDYITYRQRAYAEYCKEWRNNLTFTARMEYTRQEASPWVKFVDGFGRNFSHFDQGVMSLALRWAPGEKFTNSNTGRSRINRDALVINFRQEYGPKGLFGARYNYCRSMLTVDKIFWFSAYGYVDIHLNASMIWTQVPFTALCWQDANTSYTLDRYSFSLMNPMEFAMDRTAAWNVQYFMNGLLLNRIPGIKKLKLREVIGFRGFVGHLSDKNNPAKAQGVLAFPDPNTRPMGNTPYMECSVGLENILTFLRVDYVWRLTYRDRPGISHGGVRVGLHFTF